MVVANQSTSTKGVVATVTLHGMKKNIACLQMPDLVWDSETQTKGASSRLASRIRRKGSSSMIGNMIYWIIMEFIVVFIFRYICLFVFGHDLFDIENNVNRFIYIVIIVASLLWIKGKMSVEGLYELGANYNRKYTTEQLKRMQKDDDMYNQYQQNRRASRKKNKPGRDDDD